MFSTTSISLLLAATLMTSLVDCKPQQPVADGSSTTPIPIISHQENFGDQGTYNFSFETGNGIHAEQAGYVKPPTGERAAGLADDEGPQPIQVISGSYSYQAPDGTQISLKYLADENGFQPEGAHLPTAPPVPAGIQQNIAGAQAQQLAPTAANVAGAAQVGTVRAARPAQNTAPPAPGPAVAALAANGGDSAAAASIPNVEILRP